MRGVIYLIFSLFVVFSSCEGPQDPNRPGDKLTGYITYVDTNLIVSNSGYYSISIYSADSSYPFLRVPIRTDSVNNFLRVDFHYLSSYSMVGVPNGRIHIAATWSRYPKMPGDVPLILGTYGCDTSRTCTNHGIVVFPNVEGNFRNITCWTDTTKKLF